MNSCYYVFDAGGYDITVTTGSRGGAGTNSVMSYRLQGTDGDSGTRVFPGQEPDMFERDRCSIAHSHAADLILLRVKQITRLAVAPLTLFCIYVMWVLKVDSSSDFLQQLLISTMIPLDGLPNITSGLGQILQFDIFDISFQLCIFT